MVYMGDVHSSKELKVSSERLKAIIEAPAPQNQSEVKSFLGSVQFRTSQPYRVCTIMLAHERQVWWPQMDNQVKQTIQACHPCQLVGPRSKPEPVTSTRLSDSPWQEISIDILETSDGSHLLVVRLLLSLDRSGTPQ